MNIASVIDLTTDNVRINITSELYGKEALLLRIARYNRFLTLILGKS